MVAEQRTFFKPLRFNFSLAISAALTLLSVAGCYSPDLSSLPDCTLPCQSECPNGLECRNNFCARTASTATCAAGEGGSGAVSGTGAVGGSTPIATGGVGGVGGVGNAAGVGAVGGSVGGADTSPFAVQAATVATLCPGEGFQVQLTASGGAPPYTWSLPDAAAATTHLSATTGSVIEVSGIASKPQPEVQVRTKDSNGAVVTTSITPTVGVIGPGECPQITDTRLPDPCLENPYLANNILVTGGTSPFVWDALSIPEGLSFDATTQVVSGTALASGVNTPLTLQVTDHKGHKTQLTYPLAYRDRCWLGFTSATGAAEKMRLYDPALEAFAPSLEGSSDNSGVVDFKFSPDGKFLVYRRATGSPSAQSLVLAAAPNWQEQPLAFEGSVLSYSWSQAGTVLAVAYQNATDTLLGGVDVTNAVGSASSGGSITGAQFLTPVVMLDPSSAPLSSDLLWFQGDTYLAFHADSLFFDDFPYCAHFDGSGFSTPEALGGILYDPSVQLLPAQRGIFAVEPVSQPQLNFHGSAGGTDFNNFVRLHYFSAVADPAGKYVALPLDDKLQIELTAESGGQEDDPTRWLPSTDECTSILAWDASHERIACDARGTPPTGEVRIFDLAGTDAVPQLSSSAIKGLNGYHQGAARDHSRSFSPTGKWLAFVTDSGLEVADVSGQPQIQQAVGFPNGSDATSPSEVAFSPDESLLLWHVAGQLSIIELQTNGTRSWYAANAPLLSPVLCNEEFTAGPSGWCGKPETPETTPWSPDSHFVAAHTEANGIRVYDLHDPVAVPTLAPCASDCSGDFAFQPSTQSQPP